jgi:hypothetical protein
MAAESLYTELVKICVKEPRNEVLGGQLENEVLGGQLELSYLRDQKPQVFWNLIYYFNE